MWEPDPKTLQQARRGDTQAFERIVRGLLPEVLRLARHLVRDEYLAEDVAQEAFLRAFQALDRFKGDSRLSTWILRITRNASVDAIRRDDRRRRLAERAAPPQVPDLSLRAELDEALGSLPTDLYEAFVVVEIFGLGYEDAAQVLSLRPGTLKSRMHRCRKLLVQELSDQEGAGEV